MTNFRITHEWNSYDDSLAEVGETTARVGIFLNGHCLTRNEDIWSKTIRNQMHVSLYPLAMWFASSWWRLHYEVLPDGAQKVPCHHWRMSHEMVAANMGFVWPQIIFSADNDGIQVWAQASQENHASQENKEEAVRFLNGLSHARSVPREQFTQEISTLIENVLARLHETGCKSPDLSAIWSFISEDREDPQEYRKRRLEAALGFDPEGCSDDLITRAIELEDRVGGGSFSELAGAYAQKAENRLHAIQDLVQAEGLEGTPDALLDFTVQDAGQEPWQLAVSAAQEVRKKLGDAGGKMDSSTLQDLLGLPSERLKNWLTKGRPKASIAAPENGRKMKFIPRRTHPVAQRFELARFIGDYVRSIKQTPHSWLVSADLSTARQKFQRAFAAEFLCPIESLVEHLDGDFSETAREDAANRFLVSEKTVDALLMNNGYLPRYVPDSGMPYNLAS